MKYKRNEKSFHSAQLAKSGYEPPSEEEALDII
jgi:hypothetical protein